MNRWNCIFCGLLIAWWIPGKASGQGDWSFYDTFSRFAPSVFSISVEIPQKYINARNEEVIKQYRDLMESISGMVAGSSGEAANPLSNNSIHQVRRKMDIMLEQMLTNNRIQCAGFAIGPHHLVTMSNFVKSATFGGLITVKDDSRGFARAIWIGSDDLTGVAVLQVNDVTFTHYVDLNEYNSHLDDPSQPIARGANPLPVASNILTIQRPYDLTCSPFSGIIGGYNRLIGMFEIEKYIQTNLPLFPGNEGSPVFSPSGQLVGMMATEFHIGNNPSVTFVIPADIVADAALSIMESGKRERGWISGVGLGQDVNGILVQEVIPQSPAALAGLQKGDIIVGFNGVREKRVWNLIDWISKSKPNEIIRFEVTRGSQTQWIEILTSIRQIRK